MISGMMMPTESVVMANIMNMKNVRALMAVRFLRVTARTSIPMAAGNVESMFPAWSGMGDRRRHCFQIDAQPRPFGVVPPLHPDAVIVSRARRWKSPANAGCVLRKRINSKSERTTGRCI